jgi:predicted NACHT family NTPase
MLSSSDSTDILINAARSISYLGNSLMVVDGLDDLPDDSLEKLSIELSKLSEYENLSIIISCRDEVFNNSAKLQTLRENLGFGVINLESWDEKAIEHIILDEVAKDRNSHNTLLFGHFSRYLCT